MSFIRRYLSDKCHRIRADGATTYCGQHVSRLDYVMRRASTVGRCEKCEDSYERANARKRERAR